MSIYGHIPQGAARSKMGMAALLTAGVSPDALRKRALQVNGAEHARNTWMARANEASSLKQLRRACDGIIEASVRVEFMKELIRIEPVAGPLYRPEEIKARLAAWRHARSRRADIAASVRRSFFGDRSK